MFNEFFNPPLSVVSLVLTAAARRPADPTGSHVSTSLEHDASSMDVKKAFLNAILLEVCLYVTQRKSSKIKTSQNTLYKALEKRHSMVLDNPTRSYPVDNPMVDKSKLDEDLQGKPADPTHYCGMIGSLMYLTSSRPDLVFIVCMCAWYQSKPSEKHLHAVKRIFRYLKGTIIMGLWYSKDSCITLTAYADAAQAGCQDTRCSTSGSA
ncbi:hypothetical protein Tco_0585465 [Tanacetum coccineum]